MKKLMNLVKDRNGFAVVEMTFLFPIFFMILFGLILLAIYIPTRAALQRATQYAATAIATEMSDTWIFFDENNMKYYFESSKDNLQNVYVSLIRSIVPGSDYENKAVSIVRKMEESSLSYKDTSEPLVVEYGLVNYVIYKEIVLTATRTVKVPINLSFVGFPEEIPITVTSTAVVQNGDEFVRNMDIAVDFVKFLDNKYNLSETFSGVSEVWQKIEGFLGW